MRQITVRVPRYSEGSSFLVKARRSFAALRMTISHPAALATPLSPKVTGRGTQSHSASNKLRFLLGFVVASVVELRAMLIVNPHERAGLTPRQQDVFDFLRAHQREYGYMPSLIEIADHFSVTKVTAFEHVRALQAKRYIEVSKHKARSMRIIPVADVAACLAFVRKMARRRRRQGNVDGAERLERMLGIRPSPRRAVRS
jgi:hypothetical protein